MDDRMQLTLESDTFAGMKKDFDSQLQKLFEKMKSRNMEDGKITLNVDISLEGKEIPVFDGTTDVTQKIFIPTFDHKVTTEVKEKSEVKGTMNSEMKLVWDEETKTYVMAYINNTTQKSIFDDDIKKSMKEKQEDGQDKIETSSERDYLNVAQIAGPTEEVEQNPQALEGHKVIGLPDNSETAGDGVIDVEPEEMRMVKDTETVTYNVTDNMVTSWKEELKLFARLELDNKETRKWMQEDLTDRFFNIERAAILFKEKRIGAFISYVDDRWCKMENNYISFGIRLSKSNVETFRVSYELFLQTMNDIWEGQTQEASHNKPQSPEDDYEYEDPAEDSEE